MVAVLGYRAWFLWKAERLVAEATAELDRSDPGWRLEEIRAAREALPSGEDSAPLVLAVAELLPEKWPSRLATTPENLEEIEPGILKYDISRSDLRDHLGQLEPVDELSEGWAKDLRAELDALGPALDGEACTGS